MNNSFPRLIDGMIEALLENVLPRTDGEFARGQLFGVIYMLKNLRIRASWSPAFLGEQLDALEELRVALLGIDGWPPSAPCPAERPGPRATVDELVQARDAADGRVCDLIDWLAAAPGAAGAGIAKSADAAIAAYLRRQLKHELKTSPKPMFAEISLGRETAPKGAA